MSSLVPENGSSVRSPLLIFQDDEYEVTVADADEISETTKLTYWQTLSRKVRIV